MTKSPEGTAADSQGWSVAEPLVVRTIPIIQAPSGRQAMAGMLAQVLFLTANYSNYTNAGAGLFWTSNYANYDGSG